MKPTSANGPAQGKPLPGPPRLVKLTPPLASGASSGALDPDHSGGATADPPLGIAQITLVGETDKFESYPSLHAHYTLCVAFDDGSMRPYALKEIMAAF